MICFPLNDNSKLSKQISENIIIYICGYATCATYGTSATNLRMAITHQEIV